MILGGDEVLVVAPDVETFVDAPLPPTVEVEAPEAIVTDIQPDITPVLIDAFDVEFVELSADNPDTILVPVVGPQGPQGIPGVGESEVFVQTTLPAQGSFPWFLAQLDAPGGTVEFVKVYEP